MLQLRSPAKINLFLRILRRRDDGFHEIATLIQAVDLFDTLSFAPADKDHFRCSDGTLPTDEANLVVKAINLFRKKTGTKLSVDVSLEKVIPHQAGLGGGSGNAATALWAMNILAGSPAAPQQLMEWGSEIGSDIPFFFTSGTAYCCGRGEKISDVGSLKSLPASITLYKPPVGLSTPSVYKNLNVAALPSRNPEELLQGFLCGRNHYHNDLESSAFDLSSELAGIYNELIGFGYERVMLSGSGSALFCIGKGLGGKNCAKPLWQCTVKPVNRDAHGWYS